MSKTRPVTRNNSSSCKAHLMRRLGYSRLLLICLAGELGSV